MTLLLPLCLVLAAVGQPSAVEVRVGVVAFEDSARTAGDYERLFEELTAEVERPVSFRLAIGTYGDVLYWLEKELVDVAVLTPGVFVRALELRRRGRPACQFLASRRLPPVEGSLLADDEAAGPATGYRDRYRSVCVVREDSPLETLGDVRGALAADRLRLVFVDPLSASGRIAPMAALNEIGVRPNQRQVEYSYSHTNSLRLLKAASDGRERVAFVWDGAWSQAADLPPLRRLEFRELERRHVPADAVVARQGYEYAERVAELLVQHRDAHGEHDFERPDDWRERYRELSDWTDELRIPLDDDEVRAVSLDGVGQMLLHYLRTRPEGNPPRLALVLSGGGAKCAYQIGAVTALEEKLAELRRETGEEGMRISLVAGTSGGALNALAIALGTSSTAEGQAELRRAWRGLDQREIVRPSRLVRGNMGLWFVCVELALLLWLVRKIVRQPGRRVWTCIVCLAALAAMQILMRYARFSPWAWFGDHHWLHHLWLWGTLGVGWAGWFLLASAVASAVWQLALARSGRSLAPPRWVTTWLLTVGLLGLPLAQVLAILFYEQTLSDGAGMERRLLESFTDLASFRAGEMGQPRLDTDPEPPTAERLKSISRQILQKRLLARDLVVTGSCLEQTSADLPSDLYFYAPAGSAAAGPPDYGERGVALAERPEMLLDVVLGSGSVFPVFPPRTLENFPRRGERIELIDGGFVHNSPVEAAVRWGATHVVLIEADPHERAERRNFLQNAAGAFNHLYYQAQQVDARSREREQVVIFSLRPEPPHICMLDFADNLIDLAIDKGYREARGEPSSSAEGPIGLRRFRKELGQPLFFKERSEVRGREAGVGGRGSGKST
ncbi:MAG TPA: PhnD/SsuA/transferrin family substrate-binding protein [Pirellulales bacterium]|nr:PhnD/SsuA/transferrin family substrate-binding protein [Pirellulales bacterium]